MTKILLVEDDKSLREIYGVRLLAEGYDIVSAGDGEEALAMAIKEKPTLIISDVMMPKISGFDMLDILRSTTETRDIKVIMMTALSSDDQRSRGEQLGADRYLVKSQVGIEDVVRTVHEVLADVPGAAAGAVPAVTPQTPPVAAVADPTPTADTAIPAADSPAPAVTPVSSTPTDNTATPASPGNDAAGPLPPQPTETSLPQPTAPFSSPRPANLGERVIQPLEDTADMSLTPEMSDQISKELQASAEPVANTQVDEAISDIDVEPANTETIADTIADSITPVAAESAVDTIAPTSVEPVSPSVDEKPTINGVSGQVS